MPHQYVNRPVSETGQPHNRDGPARPASMRSIGEAEASLDGGPGVRLEKAGD
ncbi:MAG: hypothetical protein AAFX54_02825 [Pseudomonadota bacterium]